MLIVSLAGSSYLLKMNQSLKNQLKGQVVETIETKKSDPSLVAFKEELALMKEEVAQAKAELLNPLQGIRVRDETGKTTTEPPKTVEPKKEVNPSLPQITVEPTTVDLGTISQADGVAKASYKITNTGGSDLTIYSSFSSCGCTTAPIKNKTLTPNESTVLEVEYDPNYFKGLLGQGEIEKRITIISNDPNNAFYKVYLKINVIP